MRASFILANSFQILPNSALFTDICECKYLSFHRFISFFYLFWDWIIGNDLWFDRFFCYVYRSFTPMKFIEFTCSTSTISTVDPWNVSSLICNLLYAFGVEYKYMYMGVCWFIRYELLLFRLPLQNILIFSKAPTFMNASGIRNWC